MRLIEMSCDGEITLPKDVVEKLEIRDEVSIKLGEGCLIIQPIKAFTLDYVQAK